MPALLLDTGRFEQVLNNLISNAVKFSPDGTTIQLWLRRQSDNALIEVRDQGPGMSRNDLDRMFEPFRSLRRTGTAGEPGTGLGLVIARRIVNAHGGRIWAESSPGQGSSFFVQLPL